MPGDPAQCRAHALQCVQLAGAAPNAEGCQKLLRLAEMWNTLAAELESVQPLLTAINEMQFPGLRGDVEKR